ncbi:hypothetical protein [Simiduia agarivorans]|uniref:DUF4124 domain-containing protein n=1 Tax=Simiduia agarivorans (strain DSM 21679 / JCM 13881 / BCRC 17597 / SA1) TaxID=1117647 RepID=K4KNV4_SIMAS|nr:hypothetical protein [Simiduia agarivorans]AFV00860.1 hypothetical protein M5M_18655 [Simiduia agarivorans SA1 = DSM 21679]
MPSLSAADTVLRCEDPKGRPIFTDDPRRCRNKPTESVAVEVHNSHGQYGLTASKEYYNYANRALIQLDDYRLNIWVEREMLERDPQMTHAAAKRLQAAVNTALLRIPASHRSDFDGIRYYLFGGTHSSYGGKDRGLWYFPVNNRISARFDNAIVINSAANYLAISDQWALAGAIHELAHAFNHYHWRRLSRAQKAAFENTLANKRYLDLAAEGGRRVAKAYALTNQKEYFAELSVLFFAHHHAFPYDRPGLERYDPEGYALMERAWLTKETEQTVSTRQNRW